MFEHTVVVASDCSGTDICLWPDICIANIRQMIDLGPFTDLGGFDFNEIPDLRPVCQLSTRP